MLTPQAQSPFRNIDICAFVQLNPAYYAAINQKDYYKSLFQPTPEVKARVEPLWTELSSKGQTIVGIHLRRGDYLSPPEIINKGSQGYHYLYHASPEWYLAWLEEVWSTLSNSVLFIASDDLDAVLADFAEYSPVTAKALGVDFPEAEFYPDFYILSKCDVLAISNSTFSFIAALLNENAQCFVRPYLPTKELIPFLP